MKRFFWPAVLLIVVVIGVYGRTATFSFIQFDDPQMIVNNPDLCCGITAHRLHWVWCDAWRASVFFIRPLALMSHLVDGAIFGRRAGGHHLINVGWHLGCVLLLMTWLTLMTGSRWRSFFVAALFAVHPWNADVVAWVAQRSTLVSGLFFLGALIAYQAYIRRHTRKQRYRGWTTVFLLFVAAVMAKPSAVVLPLVLLLVDWLGSDRMENGPENVKTVILEKVPFFIVTGGVILLVMIVSRSSGAVVSHEVVPFSLRAVNAVVSLGIYLLKTVLPTGLCVYYPFPQTLSPWPVIPVALLLLVITALLLRRRWQAPLALFGWLWFLVTLLPALGLFQAGPWPARADHYMYVPLMGLLVSVVYLIPGRWRKPAYVAGMAVLLAAYGMMGFRQAGFYRNSQVAFSRALAVTTDNFLAHTGLGNVRMEQGRMSAAEAQFRQALALQPETAGAHVNLGLVLAKTGRFSTARYQYQRALALNPHLVEAHVDLANLMVREGQDQPAIRHYLAALAIDPNLAEANYNLGRVLAARGKFVQARRYLAAARAACPSDERYQRAWEQVRPVVRTSDDQNTF